MQASPVLLSGQLSSTSLPPRPISSRKPCFAEHPGECRPRLHLRAALAVAPPREHSGTDDRRQQHQYASTSNREQDLSAASSRRRHPFHTEQQRPGYSRNSPSASRPVETTGAGSSSEAAAASKAINKLIIDAFNEAQRPADPRGASVGPSDSPALRFANRLEDLVAERGRHFDTVNTSTAVHRLAVLSGGPAGEDPATRRAVHFVLGRLLELVQQQLADFSFRALANVLWGMAKLDCPGGPAFLDSLAVQAMSRFGSAAPQNLANVLWAYAKLGHNPIEGRLCVAVIVKARSLLPHFTFQGLANMVYAVAVLGHPASAEFLQDAARHALQKLPGAKPHEVSQLLYAYARLELSPLGGRLVGAALQHSSQRLHHFSVQGLANLVWAVATLQHPAPPDFLRDLAKQAVRQMHSANEQCIGSMLHAFAKLGTEPLRGALLAAAAARARRVLPEFKLQGAASTVWALGRFRGMASCQEASDLPELLAEHSLGLMDGANPEEVAALMAAYAELGSPGPHAARLMDAAVVRCRATLDRFRIQALATVLYSLAVLKHPVREDVLEDICAAACRKMAGAHAADVSNILYACTQLRVSRQRLLGLIVVAVSRSRRILPACSIQGLANIVYAITISGKQSGPEFLDEVGIVALSKVQTADAHELVNLLYACAKFGASPLSGRLFAATCTALEPNLGSLALGQLSNVVWAVGAVQAPVGSEFLDAAAKAGIALLPRAGPVQISKLLSGFAGAGYSPLGGAFFDAALQRAQARLPQFSVPTISAVVSAIAAARHPADEKLLEALARCAVHTVSNRHMLRPQHVADLLWGYGRLGLNPLAGLLLDALLPCVQKALPKYGLAELAKVLWSAAALKQPLSTEFLERAAESALLHISPPEQQQQQQQTHPNGPQPGSGRGSSAAAADRRSSESAGVVLQDLAQLLSSFASFRVNPCGGRLFDEALMQLGPALPLLPAASLAEVGWACAVLQHPVSEDVVAALAASLPRVVEEGGNPEATCQFLWALAALAALGPGDLRRAAASLAPAAAAAALPPRALRTLLEADLAVAPLVGEPTLLPGDIRQRALEVWRERARAPQPSTLHRDIAATLAALGIPALPSQPTPDGMFTLDFLIPAPGGRQVALQADVPALFSANDACQPLGALRLRNEALEARGYCVVSVPCNEWWFKVKARGAKEAFLRERLARFGVVPGGGGGAA